MVRPGKKAWKLFTKTNHQSLVNDGAPVTAMASADSPVGKDTARDAIQEQQHGGKKGRSWFGRKTSKKQTKAKHSQSQNQSHNDTFQTVGTEDDHRAAAATATTAAAAATVDGQMELFPNLQISVPMELEVGLRPASDDEFSRAELEIWQNAVNNGPARVTEGVEASVVPSSRPDNNNNNNNNSKDVDDPFLSIRVTPFGADEREGDTVDTGLALTTTPDLPSVEPFPAFEEVEEIPRFWRDEEGTIPGAVSHCTGASFLGQTSKSSLTRDEDASIDFQKPFTSNFAQFDDAEIFQKISRAGKLHDNNQFEDADETLAEEEKEALRSALAQEKEEALEPSIETRIPATPASSNSEVDSKVILDFPVSFPETDAPVVLPEDDASGDRYFLEVSVVDKTPLEKLTTASNVVVATSSGDMSTACTAPSETVVEDTEQSDSVGAAENSKVYPLDRKISESSSPAVLSPSQVSSRRTVSSEPGLDLDAPTLHAASSDGYDYSVSSESDSIKWSSSDLESNEHGSKVSAAAALSSVPSSGSQQCNSSACMADESTRPTMSASGIVELHVDDVGFEHEYHCRADEESFPESEMHNSGHLNDDETQAKTEAHESSEHDKDVEISDQVGSHSSETRQHSVLGTIDNDKLALVKRVSSVGHLSVGQHSLSNSEMVTPVRQNHKKVGFSRNITPNQKEKQFRPPSLSKDGDSVPESLGNQDIVCGITPPEYLGSTGEYKEEWDDLHTNAAATVHQAEPEGNEDSLKVKWMEEEIAGKVDWPEEDEEFAATHGSGNMNGSIRHSESEDSQETLPSFYKQRTSELANRKKQARELQKRGSVYVDEEESVKIPGLPFISGIRLGALNTLASDFDCSFFTSHRHADDASDDGSGIAVGTFEEEDESLVSYDDEETCRDEETYRTTGSSTGNDGIDRALNWADENFLCNQS